MIIPETIVCKKQEQYQNNNNNNMNYDDEKFIYFKDKDYFVEIVETDLIASQLLTMFVNNNLGLITKRRQRYIFIIDRRNKPNMLYFIIPKQFNELPIDWNIKRELALSLSQNYIIPPAVLKYKNHSQCNICLSYQLFTSNNCKIYAFINGTGHKFELDDIQHIWPIYFKEINGKKQNLSDEIIYNIQQCNINNKLRNDDFDEFINQCKNLRLKGYPSDIESESEYEYEEEDYEQKQINIIKER
eukprot:6246_1